MVRPDSVRRLLFRDVLAHFYPVVDYDRVHAALGETADLEEFAAFVARALDATPS